VSSASDVHVAGRGVVWATILSVVSCLLAGCASGATAGTAAPSLGRVSGQAVPGLTTWQPGKRPDMHEVSGVSLAGGHLTVPEDMSGQVVVLNVWASWCYPCRAEVPALVAAARATSSQGIVFVGIDEEDASSSARSFVAAHHVPYSSLVDSDGQLLAGLGLVPADAIPSTLVVDRTGHVAARFIGPATAVALTEVLSGLTGAS
jgi:thiol-disulfide isomerase/thioredoxin